MNSSFKDLINRIKIGADFLTVDFLDDSLFRCYIEFHRHYHTLENHLFPGLNLLESVRGICDNSDFVELAWWYHDAIYIPSSSINEEISADNAYFDCIQLGLGEETASTIRNMVLATKHSKIKPKTQDEKVLHDIDLAILGEDPEKYDEYTKGIRLEYGFVNDKDFYQGRYKILEHFINEKPIFFTKFFQDLYEKKAVNNIILEMDEIRKKTPLLK